MEVLSKGNKREIFSRFDVPKIYNILETVEMLLDTKKSFSRFGDGEFSMITESYGQSFQNYDENLSKRLREIVQSNNDDVEIGINRIYFYKDGFESPYIEDFLYNKRYGKTIIKNNYFSFLTRDHYYDSVISVPYHHYAFGNEFFEDYFSSIKKLFEKKDIIIVTGDDIEKEYKFNIFKESAKSIEVIKVSKRNAFRYYDRILDYVKNSNPKGKKLVLPICGHTATVLSYDLGSCGIRTIDIGHLAKEYNSFRLGITPYSMMDSGFF